MSDTGSGADVITDFEDGLDAIEFLIASFGVGRLGILQDDDGTLVGHGGGRIRLVDVDAEALDRTDVVFAPPG